MLGYKRDILKDLKCDNGVKPFDYDNGIIHIRVKENEPYYETKTIFNDLSVDINSFNEVINILLNDNNIELPKKGYIDVTTYNDTIIFEEKNEKL